MVLVRTRTCSIWTRLVVASKHGQTISKDFWNRHKMALVCFTAQGGRWCFHFGTFQRWGQENANQSTRNEPRNEQGDQFQTAKHTRMRVGNSKSPYICPFEAAYIGGSAPSTYWACVGYTTWPVPCCSWIVSGFCWSPAGSATENRHQTKTCNFKKFVPLKFPISIFSIKTAFRMVFIFILKDVIIFYLNVHTFHISILM